MCGTRKAFAIGVTMSVAVTLPIFAQDLDVSWHTIDGGGGTSSGGAFDLLRRASDSVMYLELPRNPDGQSAGSCGRRVVWSQFMVVGSFNLFPR